MDSLAQGKVIAGRYRLERPLAKGGMGSVWVARHLQLDVDVAVKFMSAQLATSEAARARFEREAKAAALLRMANAVNVSDYGVEGDVPFMVMELLEGEDLQGRLMHAGTLGLAETRAIFDPVCKVLRRAHELGLVHRDLKPGNIFLARQGGEEVVKVLDFGIAKDTGAALGGSATQTGAMLGSPHYMSPEQVRSTKGVDHRTDLWALGVIAYQCLTGHLPFSGDEVGEILVEVCTAPIPAPSTIVPALGAEVDGFIARALDRDPARRFQSAAELYDAFAAIGAPAIGAPAIGAPAIGAPARASSPTFNAPAFNAPAFNTPAFNAPAFNTPAFNTPAFGAPALNTSPAPAPASISAAAPVGAITGPPSTAASIATLSPSTSTAHAVPTRRPRGVIVAAAIVAGSCAVAAAAFVALRAPSPSPAPSSTAAALAAAPRPAASPEAAAVPLPSTSTTSTTSTASASASALDGPSGSALAPGTASPRPPSKDPRGRPSTTKGRSKTGDDPLDHM